MKAKHNCEQPKCTETANIRLADVAGNALWVCEYHQHEYRPYYMTATELRVLDAANAERQRRIDSCEY